jgi:hypothetical protein
MNLVRNSSQWRHCRRMPTTQSSYIGLINEKETNYKSKVLRKCKGLIV